MEGSEARVLTRRELNRALLARQMLLERAEIPVLDAVERLVALQAQVVSPPHVGLWTRLAGYRREKLCKLLVERKVVRATLLRSTLHLMSSRDYLRFRLPLGPAISSALPGFFGEGSGILDLEEVRRGIREKLASERLSRGGISSLLAELYPHSDAQAMVSAAISNLPLVQTPSGENWGYTNKPLYALAEDWLGEEVVSPENGPQEVVLRYLAAFGPASVMDFHAWSGLTKTKPVFEELRPDLVTYRDENGRELFDLPDARLPDAEVPAPPRFVPDYDNLVLSHANRTRIVADRHKKRVFLSAARVRATVLVDGFVAGTWKVEEKRREATLAVEPFGRLAKGVKVALGEEGEKLAEFLKPDARTHVVRFEA